MASSRAGVEVFRYRGADPGQVLVGVSADRQAAGEEGVMEPAIAAGGIAGQYVPVTDGDLVDPQPLYITNADGVPVFLMIWVDF